MLYVSEGVHQMLRDEQERTGKSIEEIAADLIKASLPFHNPAGGDGRRRSLILRLALASATTGATSRVDGGGVETIA